MPEIRTNLYEGLFLLDQQAMASDYAGSLDHVRQILLKAKAEVVAFCKWDERRLAYEVKGQKRGTFVLAHFRAQSDRLTGIDRDCNLSEIVLRSMVIKADHIGEVELQQYIDDAATSAVEDKLREGRAAKDDAKAEAAEAAEPAEAGAEVVVEAAAAPQPVSDPAPAEA